MARRELVLRIGTEQAFDLARSVAHAIAGTSNVTLAAGTLAAVLHSTVFHESINASLERAKALLVARGYEGELLSVLRLAGRLANCSDRLPDRDISTLLAEADSFGAFAAAVYCSIAASSFWQGAHMAVSGGAGRHDLPALAGCLLGARFGVEKIPLEWLTSQALRSRLCALADQLLLLLSATPEMPPSQPN